jgi:hypothetical protein
MGSSFFRDVTQRKLVVKDVSGQYISPAFNIQAVRGKSVTNYRSSSRNIPAERRSNLKSIGSLKSSNYCNFPGLEFT